MDRITHGQLQDLVKSTKGGAAKGNLRVLVSDALKRRLGSRPWSLVADNLAERHTEGFDPELFRKQATNASKCGIHIYVSFLYWMYENQHVDADIRGQLEAEAAGIFMRLWKCSVEEAYQKNVSVGNGTFLRRPGLSATRPQICSSLEAVKTVRDEQASAKKGGNQQSLSQIQSRELSLEMRHDGDPLRNGSKDTLGRFASSAVVNLPVSNMIDAPIRNKDFTGRTKELETVHASLSNGRGRAAITQKNVGIGRTTIAGLGGIGKTTIAVEYVNEYGDQYDGVWWCRSETTEELVASLHGLAARLKIVSENESDAQKAAKFCLQWLDDNNIRILLVYDNVPSPATLIGFLPSSAPSVLITSQFPDWGAWADQVELDVWPSKDALTYIYRRLPQGNHLHAEALVEALGRLPLALDHASAYCIRTQTKLDEYARKVASLIAELPRDRPNPRSVAATFTLNFTAAAREHPSAALLMKFIGYCGPERIPNALLQVAVNDDTERIRGLQALSNVSLIKADPLTDGTAAWRVHRLVQAVARSEHTDDKSSVIAKLGDQLASIFPSNTYNEDKEWNFCDALIPHVRVVFDAACDNATSMGFAPLFDAAGLYMLARGFLPQSAAFLNRALEICRRPSYAQDEVRARVLSNVALLLHTQGRLKEAVPYCREALWIRKRKFGLDNVDTLTSLNNLAYLYMDLTRYSKAKPLFKICLEHTRRLFSENHPETATALDNLGYLYRRMGLLSDAFRHSRNAFRVRIRVQGADHIDTAFSYDSVASILYCKGKRKMALCFFDRSEATYIRRYGLSSVQAAKASIRKAEIISDYGNHEEALVRTRDALSILEQSFGVDHVEYAQNQEIFAKILIRLNNTSEAINELRRAANVYAKTFGQQNSETERCTGRIALLKANHL